MIYITGDCHGNYSRFARENFPQQDSMTKDDFMIVCGDFGLWEDSPRENKVMDALQDLPFTILWVDGNHENYDLIRTFPVQKWHGGNVQFIRPNVIHLMRGQVFEIDGYSFFTFGGANCHDIDGGVPLAVRQTVQSCAAIRFFYSLHFRFSFGCMSLKCV
ncbi:MAG: metallophosphoesterase family protein, partial [Eubacteriaceae bacterium]